MGDKVKSRQEKRKEARVAKSQHKYQSWISHQKVQSVRKKAGKNKKKPVKEHNSLSEDFSARSFTQSDVDSENNQMSGEKIDVKVKSVQSTKEGRKENKSRKRKTKFEEFLEMTIPSVAMSAEEDMKLERRLAKKLKVKKGGKLPGFDDELNELLEGVPSFMGSLSDDEVLNAKKCCEETAPSKKSVEDFLEDVPGDDIDADQEIEPSSREDMSDAEVSMEESLAEEAIEKRKQKRRKSKKNNEQDVELADDIGVNVAKTVESTAVDETNEEAPSITHALKEKPKYVAPHMRNLSGRESQDCAQIRRRVRGLLNRLSESNVESITGEVSTIFRSISRSVASQIISEEIVASCSGGPRGNEQYAAVFAAFVAGMACSVGMDFSAKLLASLAKSFENEYLNEDNLSLRNLTLLLSYLCIFGVCSSDLIYDVLIMLSKRLTEVDVSTILTILQCCGMKIRGDDPVFMKSFIQSVQNRVNELKATPEGCQQKINGKRMEFMLETICDIKNNKRRPKEDSAQHTRMKKWLQKLKVEDVLIRGLTWSKLLDTSKKGQWWLSGDMVSTAYNVEEVAGSIDKDAVEAQKMLQLASAQRMNTDARKAIFCIIMSAEDYIDAFEKLLRLDLHGKQDREIMRVVVECCLQEEVFNKYYTALALKLCEHERNHKFTLQFCLWDHFKELESMHLQRSMHLAKFMAEMIASFSLSIAVLKTVDFTDPVQLTPKRIIHFRMFFEAMFEYSNKVVWNTFTRVAVAPELEALRNGIEFFIKEYVMRANKGVTEKYKLAKKALNNIEGILM